MKKQIMLALTVYVSSMIGIAAADISAADKQYLRAYEQVRAALAADDLGRAKEAAGLGPEGSAIATSKSLAQARDGFAQVSGKAAKIAAGQRGYFVMHCPMANKDWVQTSDKPNNPYLGKQMLTCGELKK
jgi:hypothetical protein